MTALGVRPAQGVGGIGMSSEYVVNVGLPNGVMIERCDVTEGYLGDGYDVLIGMDIIGLGDFAVSNRERTVFTYRVPSQREIDFVKEINDQRGKVGRNAPCRCGSGKKYKYSVN